MAWTDEQDAALRQCFADGMSGSEAAASLSHQFRTHISRNAVIGRGHRKGMKSQLTPADGNQSHRRAHRARPKALPKPKPKPTPKPQQFACDAATGLREADVVPRHISVLELDDGLCKWPYGDGPFTFCGCEQFPGESYCEPHSALATRAWVDKRVAA